eukprot:350848-Chlamydomonas_euryale.AAC.8
MGSLRPRRPTQGGARRKQTRERFRAAPPSGPPQRAAVNEPQPRTGSHLRSDIGLAVGSLNRDGRFPHVS